MLRVGMDVYDGTCAPGGMEGGSCEELVVARAMRFDYTTTIAM